MRARGKQLALAAAGLLLAVFPVTAAPDAPAVRQVRLESMRSAGAVERALRGARDRLARPRCQRIFDEFRDRQGRPLREQLERLGATGATHLGAIFFYDGQARPTCGQPSNPLAFTHVGSRVVYVCASFAVVEGRYPFWAEAALIHESLHTLGLGENPPSSNAITTRVMALCRR